MRQITGFDCSHFARPKRSVLRRAGCDPLRNLQLLVRPKVAEEQVTKLTRDTTRPGSVLVEQ